MKFEDAKRVIDLVMSNPPYHKIIRVYGGEPLLHFGLVEKVSKYAREMEKKEKKKLVLTLCTNTILLNKKYLDVLKNYDYKLAVSIDGKKEFHEKYRNFKNGSKGAYELIQKNAALAIKNNGKRNVTAGLGVTPDAVIALNENYDYVLNLGFDTVNIEPIFGFQNWNKKNQALFYWQMKVIISKILQGIETKKFIYLTTINRELKHRTISEWRKGRCLFYQSMEVYPEGEIGFSSYLMNAKNRAKYIIGNVNSKVAKRYQECIYKRENQNCEKCIASYFDFEDASHAEDVVNIRDLLSIEAARFIESMGEKNSIYKQYILSAKEHMSL